MHLLLEEINEIIQKFEGDNKTKLVGFYVELVKTKLLNEKPFDRTKVLVLKDVLKYLKEDERNPYITEVFKSKVIQMRALVLDLVVVNYSVEKQHIARPERWIELLINDINSCFEIEDNEERGLFKIYNELICDEIILLFCSYEKFNSGGNQLLLNIIAYQNAVEMYTDYDFSKMYDEIKRHFMAGKDLPIKEIRNIYKEYAKSKKKQNK